MKKQQRIAVIIGIFSVLLLAAAGWQGYTKYWKVTWEHMTYTTTDAVLNNPYCGWYQMYGYMLSDEGNSIFDDRTKEYIKSNQEYRLVLLELNLKQFRDRDLSETALSQMDHILAQWSESSVSVILRFLYDWEGKAASSEPDTIVQIQRHMEQAAQVVNTYTETVYLVQGIFVGNYGEMNNSAYLSKENMTELAKTLRVLLDSEIYMAVRTPAQLRTILNSADAGHVMKIGLFNDGMLASETDLGTYGAADSLYTETDYEKKGNRQQELTYQNQRSLYAPSGGEVVSDNIYNDIENAVKDLKQMRISYLNHMYDLKVLSKWKNQMYEGISGYDYITAHLGYRYELKEVNCSYKAFQKEGAQLEITVQNMGFSPAYKTFGLSVAVYDTEGNCVYQKELSPEYDTTHWYPDEEYRLLCTLPIVQLGKGDFKVYFSVSDQNTQEQIQLAVQEEPEKNGYFLGTLHINK